MDYSADENHSTDYPVSISEDGSEDMQLLPDGHMFISSVSAA